MKDETQLNNEDLNRVNGGRITPKNPFETEPLAVGDWCRETHPSPIAVATDTIYRVTAVNGDNIAVKKYDYFTHPDHVLTSHVGSINANSFAKCDPPYWLDKIGNL